MYGGGSYGRFGAGATHFYPGGGAIYHPPGYPYHPPVAVPYYAPGCPGCANAAYAMGGNYASLPSGCIMPDVGGVTWFKPSYGANGVYYVVAPNA